MLSPDDIRALASRKYPGYLRALITGEAFFPLKIPFGRPSTSEEWSTLQREITALAQGNVGYRIEWTEIDTRRWGHQRLPHRVWFDDEPAFLKALRKQAEVDEFRRQLAHTRTTCPELNAWLAANALRLIEFSSVWPSLLLVCRYFLEHPRPGLYVRELPVRVDTKFIERHQPVLRDLLDFLLPESAKLDTPHFEKRFGLRFEEPLIRLRILDPELKCAPAVPLDDLSAPLSQIAALCWGSINVLIVENKKTFLTLPMLSNTIGILGGGGAAELLASVKWLADCRLVYWGDLDVHGFHILCRLRRTFPALTSVMMDVDTFERFQAYCGPASPTAYEHASLLSADERTVYESVRAGNLLLEQEKIPYDYAVAQLRAMHLTLSVQPDARR